MDLQNYLLKTILNAPGTRVGPGGCDRMLTVKSRKLIFFGFHILLLVKCFSQRFLVWTCVLCFKEWKDYNIAAGIVIRPICLIYSIVGNTLVYIVLFILYCPICTIFILYYVTYTVLFVLY